ncbi:MAG: bifunctional UDP-N-acetylglucosamine pyrophosphorylase / glucosamine-phosphate N-acetyltransferase [Actinomycetota bacterium]
MLKRCSRCGEEKDESEFNRKTRGRLQPNCRACNSEYLKQHYRDNTAYYKAKAKRIKGETVRANQLRIHAYYLEHPCVDCGESDPIVLQFDHVRGVKYKAIADMVRAVSSWAAIAREIEKCEVRCANCHWRRTAKQFNWYAYLDSDELAVGGRPIGRTPAFGTGNRGSIPRPRASGRPTDVTATPLACVVLAAGEGKRMRSARPKPLHLLCGRAMLLHILDAVTDMGADRAVVVVGHGAERITKKLVDDGPPGLPIDFVEQEVQRGTGDAVMVALTAFAEDDDEGDLLVLPADQPLLRATTLDDLVTLHRESGAAATVLTAEMPDPTGLGRVVRGKDGNVDRIVEQRDATDEERAICEINTAVYCFKRSLLAPALRRVTPDNAQGEYYLTDVIEVLADAGHTVAAMTIDDAAEAQGVNDRAQLAAAEAELRRRTNERWMAAGVTMVDPATTYIDAGVRLGADVTLFPGVILQGTTSIGEHTEIGPGCRLVSCTIGADCWLDHTVGELAEVGDRVRVGPFASLKPGVSIAPGSVTGAFYNPT